jgi:hypothetical protein
MCVTHPLANGWLFWMMLSYRVVDLTGDEPWPEHYVRARSPEVAAEKALGLTLVRSGRRSALAAKVYWEAPGEAVSMVRLYMPLDADDGTLRRLMR